MTHQKLDNQQRYQLPPSFQQKQSLDYSTTRMAYQIQQSKRENGDFTFTSTNFEQVVHYLSFLKNKNPVAVDHRIQTMSNRQNRTILKRFSQSTLD